MLRLACEVGHSSNIKTRRDWVASLRAPSIHQKTETIRSKLDTIDVKVAIFSDDSSVMKLRERHNYQINNQFDI